MGPRRQLRVWLVLAAPSFLAACHAGNPSGNGSSPSSVAVTGYVTAGPTCPVEQAGQSCPPTAVHGSVVVEGPRGDQIAHSGTDAHGHYNLALPAGQYTFVVDHASTALPRCPSVQVTVHKGVSQRVDIACDTGIR